MGAASGMPKAYYEIYNNIKTKFEKTGKVAGKRYMRWEGPADQRAHMIAKSYVDGRTDKKNRTNQELLADLDRYYKKTRELETFNHPDYKHVHGNGYDPND